MSQKYDFRKSIADLTPADLELKITEEEQRLKKMKFAHSITPLENPMTIKTVRRDLARLKTHLRQSKNDTFAK